MHLLPFPYSSLELDTPSPNNGLILLRNLLRNSQEAQARSTRSTLLGRLHLCVLSHLATLSHFAFPMLEHLLTNALNVPTGLDCNVTFQGTDYRTHTSCISEEQRYHKSFVLLSFLYSITLVLNHCRSIQQRLQSSQRQRSEEPKPKSATTTTTATSGTSSSSHRHSYSYRSHRRSCCTQTFNRSQP